MLEQHAVKVARAVLRRGGGSNLSSLFDQPYFSNIFVMNECWLETGKSSQLQIKRLITILYPEIQGFEGYRFQNF